MVNGNQLVNKDVVVDRRPTNLNMILGWSGVGLESPGKLTDVNIFSTPISNMTEFNELITVAGTENCGAAGDFLNWQETNWTLHSKARVIEINSTRGPCRRESKLIVFPMEDYQSYCMQHCEKLGGKSPSVRTFEEWQTLAEDIQHIKIEPLGLPRKLWLSATEGDKKYSLSSLDHWPEDVVAVEGVWRDYYTGEKLDNYTKPWKTDDSGEGTTSNCIHYFHGYSEGNS